MGVGQNKIYLKQKVERAPLTTKTIYPKKVYARPEGSQIRRVSKLHKKKKTPNILSNIKAK